MKTAMMCGRAHGFSTTAIASLPALAIKFGVELDPAPSLALQILALLGSYSLLGTVTRQIQREDWSFLRRWLSGGFARG